MGDFTDDLYRILAGWERNKYYLTWDAYASKTKINPKDKQQMAAILAECRLNGFISPYIDGDNVNWHQAVEKIPIRGKLQFGYVFGDFT